MELINAEENQNLADKAEISIESLDMEELATIVGGFTGAEKAIITLL